MSDLSLEYKLWKKGYYVVGVDEVGRAPLAGPIMAGAVIFSPSIGNRLLSLKKIRIDDSKKLTAMQRERSSLWIKENALVYAVCGCTVAEINKLGIKKANLRAIRRAIYSCIHSIYSTKSGFIISDFLHIPFLKGIGAKKQLNIIKADSLSLSVSAASIIAKVKRDELMENLSKSFPVYGWEKNKGYGTKDHRDALVKYGSTIHHRKLFIRKYI